MESTTAAAGRQVVIRRFEAWNHRVADANTGALPPAPDGTPRGAVTVAPGLSRSAVGGGCGLAHCCCSPGHFLMVALGTSRNNLADNHHLPLPSATTTTISSGTTFWFETETDLEIAWASVRELAPQEALEHLVAIAMSPVTAK